MHEVASDEFSFTSADGETPIHVMTWVPTGEMGAHPKGIVQIAHGMVEHIARYDEFARFLASNGFAVCGNDHIGHGKSVVSPERLSCLPLDGANVIIQDMRTLHRTFSKRFPEGTPYILFGHSMGSFAARYYVAAYGGALAGAVFCGTGQVSTTAARLGGGLARFLAKMKGVDHESAFIQGLADGAYAKAIPNARTNLDWLNTDPAEVDKYIADPLCGKMFNLGGYASLLDLTAASCNNICARAMPKTTMILFISGAEDPVGDKSKGTTKAYHSVLYRSGGDVRLKLYDGMRHEILNEPGREQVFADVLAWLEEVVAAEERKAAIKVRLKPKSERRQIAFSGNAEAVAGAKSVAETPSVAVVLDEAADAKEGTGSATGTGAES